MVPDHQVIRDINDRIRATASALADIADMPTSFMCQCGCLTVVHMSVSEYDHVRSQGVWTDGHQPATDASPGSRESRTSFHYRMYDRDGNEVGEAHYANSVERGEAIWTGESHLLRVVVVIPTGEDSKYAAILMVEKV